MILLRPNKKDEGQKCHDETIMYIETIFLENEGTSIYEVDDLLSTEYIRSVCVYFQQNEKRRRSGEGMCHTKTMMSTKANDRLKKHTQHVSLRRSCLSLIDKVIAKEKTYI